MTSYKRLCSTKSFSVVAILILILSLNRFCFGDEEEEEETFLAPMEREEKEGLYKAVQGFVGRWWNGSDLYPDPCGWTPIQGVSCDLYDGLWYVTEINIGPIHENSLSCASKVDFKPQLFDLKHLKSLSFFNCFVSRHKHRSVSLPSLDWERLSSTLESLEFRSNPGLIGNIPESLGSLVKLRSLVLTENGVSGQLPDRLGGLVNLERLVLARNNITGKIPDNFGGLKRLLILDMNGNSLSGDLPASLGALESLLKLDLSDNILAGKFELTSGIIEGMKCLTLLDLSKNRFWGGLGLKQLGNLKSLEEMVLSNNPKIGGDLKSVSWEKLERLEVLDLTNTGLEGEIPESMAGLKRLRFLGLSDNNLSGAITPKFETLLGLGAMYLNGNNLEGELKFSGWFYGKMGRRFGAWDNSNLCFPINGVSQIPFGVKPCQPKLKLVETNTYYEYDKAHLNETNSDLLVASLGFSGSSIGAFWWLVLVFLEFLLIT